MSSGITLNPSIDPSIFDPRGSEGAVSLTDAQRRAMEAVSESGSSARRSVPISLPPS